LVLLGLLVAALVLLWYYRREQGPRLRLAAAEVIPAGRCIAYLAFRDAGDFLDTLHSTPDFQPVGSETFAEKPGSSQDGRLTLKSFPEKIPSALGFSGWEELIRQVAGDSIELVLIDFGPRAEIVESVNGGTDRTGQEAVLLWLRPRLGWRGDLATLVGPVSSGKNVVSTRVAGARFYSYHDPRDPEHGLAWTRLGPTVLVRLDSPDPGPFESVLAWGREAENQAAGRGEVRLTPLSEDPDFSRFRDARGDRPGLWGYVHALRTFHSLDSLLTGGLSRWIDPAWMPALEEPIRECPLLLLDSSISSAQGFELRFRWTRPADLSGEDLQSRVPNGPGEVKPALARSSSGNSTSDEDAAFPPPMMRIQTESRKIPEVVNWITLVSRSVAQASEEEEEAEAEEKAASWTSRIQPAPLTPEEKDARKKERRLQKECQKALLRELADPRTTARLVSALGNRVELDIVQAGLSTGGRWKPDWDFTAAVRDETRLRTSAKEFFEGVANRESVASLRIPPRVSEEPDPVHVAASAFEIVSPDLLLASTATLTMDLRAGRFLLCIPGDSTLRVGLHRYRLSGETDRWLQSIGRPVPPNLLPSFDPRGNQVSAATENSPAPTVELEVDWPRVATHLETLLQESEKNLKWPAARPGVRQFRDWARVLAPTGMTRLIIVRREHGAEWVLSVPLGS